MDPDPSILQLLAKLAPSLLVMLTLLIMSGFFSASEVALLTISPAKARALGMDGSGNGRRVARLKEHIGDTLIMILIGNNLVNVGVSVYSTVVFTGVFGSEWLGLLTGILTLLLLIFGEIVPKSVAQKNAVPFSLFASLPLIIIKWLLTPFIIPLRYVTQAVSTGSDDEKHFTDDELIALAEIGHEEGELNSDERDQIESIIEFHDTTVGEIMTPRPKIEAIEMDSTVAQAVKFCLDYSHSRIPLFEDTIDNIQGILSIKALLGAQNRNDPSLPVREIANRKPLIVPMSMKLADVMQQMRTSRSHMAIVKDEHGSTAGLVTLEDLLEEVFGDFQDETDNELPLISLLRHNRYRVRGEALIEDIDDFIEGYSEGDIPGEETDTIARVILDNLGRWPEVGEMIELSPLVHVTVKRMVDHTIELVELEFLDNKDDHEE